MLLIGPKMVLFYWASRFIVFLVCENNFLDLLERDHGFGNGETMRRKTFNISLFLSRQIFELSETHLTNYFGFWIIEMVNGMEKNFQYFIFLQRKMFTFQKYNLLKGICYILLYIECLKIL